MSPKSSTPRPDRALIDDLAMRLTLAYLVSRAGTMTREDRAVLAALMHLPVCQQALDQAAVMLTPTK